MDTAQLLGWVATFLFSIMIIPQMIKTIKSRDTSSVSLLLFVIFLTANVIALVYAVMISQPPLIIKYSIAILTTVTYIALFLFYTWGRTSSVAERKKRLQKTATPGIVLWLTGLSGSGKTTIALALKKKYETRGKKVCIIDGDAVRKNDTSPLGFSRESIHENNHRIALLAKTEKENHDLVLIPVIAPFREDREASRKVIGDPFLEVYVECSLRGCVERDVKGLYKEAREGRREKLIGMKDSPIPYEVPLSPDIRIKTEGFSPEEAVSVIAGFLEKEVFSSGFHSRR